MASKGSFWKWNDDILIQDTAHLGRGVKGQKDHKKQEEHNALHTLTFTCNDMVFLINDLVFQAVRYSKFVENIF